MTKPPASAVKTETDIVLDRRLRQFIGYNIKRTYLLIHNHVLEVLKPYNLRPTSFSALVIIADNPDLTQSQLADALQIKRSGVVLIVDEMEQNELITRNRVPGDRRSYALQVTLKGLRLRDQLVKEVQQCEVQLLSALSDEERHWLSQLYSNIENTSFEDSETYYKDTRKQGI